MGLREKVALVAIAVIIQIVCTDCKPRHSLRPNPFEKYSKNADNGKRKYNNVAQLEYSHDPTETFANPTIYKNYNFPEVEFPSDSSPSTGLFATEFIRPNQTPTKKMYDTTLLEKFKKEARRNRKIKKHINNGQSEKQRLSDIDHNLQPVFMSELGAFPEVEYPQSAMDTWGPKYWNPLPFNKNDPYFKIDDIYQTKPQAYQKSSYIKPSKLKRNKGMFAVVKKSEDTDIKHTNGAMGSKNAKLMEATNKKETINIKSESYNTQSTNISSDPQNIHKDNKSPNILRKAGKKRKLLPNSLKSSAKLKSFETETPLAKNITCYAENELYNSSATCAVHFSNNTDIDSAPMPANNYTILSNPATIQYDNITKTLNEKVANVGGNSQLQLATIISSELHDLAEKILAQVGTVPEDYTSVDIQATRVPTEYEMPKVLDMHQLPVKYLNLNSDKQSNEYQINANIGNISYISESFALQPELSLSLYTKDIDFTSESPMTAKYTMLPDAKTGDIPKKEHNNEHKNDEIPHLSTRVTSDLYALQHLVQSILSQISLSQNEIVLDHNLANIPRCQLPTDYILPDITDQIFVEDEQLNIPSNLDDPNTSEKNTNINQTRYLESHEPFEEYKLALEKTVSQNNNSLLESTCPLPTLDKCTMYYRPELELPYNETSYVMSGYVNDNILVNSSNYINRRNDSGICYDFKYNIPYAMPDIKTYMIQENGNLTTISNFSSSLIDINTFKIINAITLIDKLLDITNQSGPVNDKLLKNIMSVYDTLIQTDLNKLKLALKDEEPIDTLNSSPEMYSAIRKNSTQLNFAFNKHPNNIYKNSTISHVSKLETGFQNNELLNDTQSVLQDDNIQDHKPHYAALINNILDENNTISNELSATSHITKYKVLEDSNDNITSPDSNDILESDIKHKVSPDVSDYAVFSDISRTDQTLEVLDTINIPEKNYGNNSNAFMITVSPDAKEIDIVSDELGIDEVMYTTESPLDMIDDHTSYTFPDILNSEESSFIPNIDIISNIVVEPVIIQNNNTSSEKMNTLQEVEFNESRNPAEVISPSNYRSVMTDESNLSPDIPDNELQDSTLTKLSDSVDVNIEKLLHKTDSTLLLENTAVEDPLHHTDSPSDNADSDPKF